VERRSIRMERVVLGRIRKKSEKANRNHMTVLEKERRKRRKGGREGERREREK
jgi:hypothetical protein